jgi:hypothetical protein
VIRDDLKKLKTEPGDLRKFGLTLGGVFTLLTFWFGLKQKSGWPCLAILAALLVILALACPRYLKYVFLAWMTAAFTAAMVLSSVLLTLLFYLVVTPIGLAARCLGQDFLNRKPNRQATSHWVPRNPSVPKPKDSYERQF